MCTKSAFMRFSLPIYHSKGFAKVLSEEGVSPSVHVRAIFTGFQLTFYSPDLRSLCKFPVNGSSYKSVDQCLLKCTPFREYGCELTI